jgi:hypothetical protein
MLILKHTLLGDEAASIALSILELDWSGGVDIS